jgi:SagB-type dehydrogenase family enzyme
MSLETALWRRRSTREFTADPIGLGDLSRLLFAAQGITGEDGERTAPSAGALYPLETWVVTGRVADVASGVWRYSARGHALTLVRPGRFRARLGASALGQSCVTTAAAVVVFTAVFRRTTDTYGRDGVAYVYMEAGHAAQNLCLEAESLGLGTVAVGAVDDRVVREILELPRGERAIYMIPVGRPKR